MRYLLTAALTLPLFVTACSKPAVSPQASAPALAEAAPAAPAASTAGPAGGPPVTLRVGATPVPAGELLEFVKPALAAQGVNLEITEFTDYVTPNTALGEGSLDANLFQHQPYLDSFQAGRPLGIVPVRAIYLPALGLYSQKAGSVAELPDGATIAIPNDPSNEARALKLLEQGGLITLKAGAAANAGLDAIADNPRQFKFLELEAAQLPRSLADTDASIVNANYALEVGLSPLKDALLHEKQNSPYANILATTAAHANDPAVKRLADALTTPEVREWLLQKYGGVSCRSSEL
ncbi:MetQ/NlpA family ABC transporter substrate-binding protein [Deinococcus lacus]|uniref:Lipoprotein n=1 Tax=Deinococcus lacus TaxID=392561 RepID=A0ABW1YDP8_9DEIO